MKFKEASEFKMPFGKFKGMSLDNISKDDEGLKYLDYLLGENWVNGKAKLAIEIYLSNPTIAKELKDLL